MRKFRPEDQDQGWREFLGWEGEEGSTSPAKQMTRGMWGAQIENILKRRPCYQPYARPAQSRNSIEEAPKLKSVEGWCLILIALLMC